MMQAAAHRSDKASESCRRNFKYCIVNTDWFDLLALICLPQNLVS